MSAIAFVLASRGIAVSGSDPGILPAVKERLESVGAKIFPGPHKTENVPNKIVALIVTDAVKGENPEISEAERRGVPVFKRPEVLGGIVNAAKTAICAWKYWTTALDSPAILQPPNAKEWGWPIHGRGSGNSMAMRINSP